MFSGLLMSPSPDVFPTLHNVALRVSFVLSERLLPSSSRVSVLMNPSTSADVACFLKSNCGFIVPPFSRHTSAWKRGRVCTGLSGNGQTSALPFLRVYQFVRLI